MNNEPHPINKPNVETQTALLALFLLRGGQWHTYIDDRRHMGIGYPNSRISDLKIKFGLKEYFEQKEMNHINNNGAKSRCQLYWLKAENIVEARSHLMMKHRRFYEKIVALSA